MPDLLVVVVEVTSAQVTASLGEVDAPGRVLRLVERPRTTALPSDVARVLVELQTGGLERRLLAVAVAVREDVAPADAALLRSLAPELPEGWGLPATLPVLVGVASAWAEQGRPVPSGPLVAGAVVAAARSVGAHAHLPHE